MTTQIIQERLYQVESVRAVAMCEKVTYSEAQMMIDNGQVLSYTECEIDEAVTEYIKESLWSFNQSFLGQYSDIIRNMNDKVWCAIQDQCEDSNELILALVTQNHSLDELVNEAVSLDGYGQLLNSYDGSCEEISTNLSQTYYVMNVDG